MPNVITISLPSLGIITIMRPDDGRDAESLLHSFVHFKKRNKNFWRRNDNFNQSYSHVFILHPCQPSRENNSYKTNSNKVMFNVI